MTRDLNTHLDELREQIDRRLGHYLDGCGGPAGLVEAMRYSLLGPGKRLRPILLLLAAEACGGSVEEALPAACAIEMIHAYSLVHDDLPAMDNDDLRRGRPTCHKRFGEATAILVGDALLTLAFQVVSEDVRPAGMASRCCLLLAKAAGAAGMVGGQMDDLAAEGRGGGLEVLESIHRRKTGALFQAALRIGGLIGGREQPPPQAAIRLDVLDRFGECFGLAFQISDDLLDVEGGAARTGKATAKDAGQGKLTYPALFGIEGSRTHLRDVGRQALECLEELAPLSDAGRHLAALVQFTLKRDR